MRTRRGAQVPLTTWAEKISAIREALGETQVEFAARVFVHPMTVSKWERATVRPGYAAQRELAKISGWSAP